MGGSEGRQKRGCKERSGGERKTKRGGVMGRTMGDIGGEK
jgi:hypothetical protein